MDGGGCKHLLAGSGRGEDREHGRISDLQTEKTVKPPVLDYDSSSRKLTVVDRGFLIWLEHQDTAVLKASLDFPADAQGVT